MKYLSKEEILAKKDLVLEDAYIPQWDGHVCVKSLTGKERDKWETTITEMKGKRMVVKQENIRASLVAITVVRSREDHTLVFSARDVELLGQKNAGALDIIFDVASRLSGISDKDVEELAKNSDETQDDSSPSS